MNIIKSIIRKTIEAIAFSVGFVLNLMYRLVIIALMGVGMVVSVLKSTRKGHKEA